MRFILKWGLGLESITLNTSFSSVNTIDQQFPCLLVYIQTLAFRTPHRNAPTFCFSTLHLSFTDLISQPSSASWDLSAMPYLFLTVWFARKSHISCYYNSIYPWTTLSQVSNTFSHGASPVFSN